MITKKDIEEAMDGRFDGVEAWEIVREVLVLEEEIKAKDGQRLPTMCLAGGEHHWDSTCNKCHRKVYYNPEASIGNEGA